MLVKGSEIVHPATDGDEGAALEDALDLRGRNEGREGEELIVGTRGVDEWRVMAVPRWKVGEIGERADGDVVSSSAIGSRIS